VIAVVFMNMNMNDRDVPIKKVCEPEIVIQGFRV
jgi:hypothetical protein